MTVHKLLQTRMRVSDRDQAITVYTDGRGLEVVARKTSPRSSQPACLND